MVHRNAPLTETGRLRLARCVVEQGWPLRRTAERFQVSVPCAQCWAGRYRAEGQAGMADRPSRPRRCPRRLPLRRERRVVNLRVTRRWGPARIAAHLRMPASTVYAVLRRYQVPRLAHLDRATGQVVRRYKRARPVSWSTSISRSWATSPTAAGTACTAAPRAAETAPAATPWPPTAPAPGPSWATATYTTPSTTTPGWPTPRSCPTSAKTPPPPSGPAPPRSSPAAASTGSTAP